MQLKVVGSMCVRVARTRAPFPCAEPVLLQIKVPALDGSLLQGICRILLRPRMCVRCFGLYQSNLGYSNRTESEAGRAQTKT